MKQSLSKAILRIFTLLSFMAALVKAGCVKTDGPFLSTKTPYNFDDLNWIYNNYNFNYTQSSIKLC
jgi:hypothetical protein